MSDNAHPSSPQLPLPDSRHLSLATILAILVASAIVAGFAISTQSYWIDEATSLLIAKSKSPSEAWEYAKVIAGSTIQMPLYEIYLYAWDKAFHGNEWTSRASNIPFFILAQFAFLFFLRERPRLALMACLLTAVNPTIWMYLDEARPYLIQYAASAWLIAAIVRFSLPPPQNSTGENTAPACSSLDLFCILAAALTLIGMSFLGIIWAGAFVSALLWLYFTGPYKRSATPTSPSAASFLWKNKSLLLVAAALGCILFAYHAWVWPKASHGLHRAGLNISSILYIIYDFLGFSGYGPGKLQLRHSVAAPLRHSIPTLTPLFVVLATLALYVFLNKQIRRTSRRVFIAWFIALVIPSIISFIGMYFGDFRALPRHFIPTLPAFILALSFVLVSALTQNRLLWRFAAILLPLLWLGSSLNLRWKPIYAKDDYRTATEIATAALRNNKEVWWAADAAAAHIYFTPTAFQNTPGYVWAMQSPSWNDIRFKLPPRVIIVSKPDIYDSQGAIIRYAAENQFSPAVKLQAFTIFTRKGEVLENLPSHHSSIE